VYQKKPDTLANALHAYTKKPISASRQKNKSSVVSKFYNDAPGALTLVTTKQFYWFYFPLSMFILAKFMRGLSKKTFIKKSSKLNDVTVTSSSKFLLWLGESTGRLANMWHPSNMASGQQIGLNLTDASQNLLIMGAIGSGKTTRVMHPLLLQLLTQNCGGLIFDIKGDFKSAVYKASDLTRKEIITIGIEQNPLNLLAGLPPEIVASFLKSALLLSAGAKLDSFWIDTATELCRNVLGVLVFLPEHYNLHSLYRYLFSSETKKIIDEKIIAKTLNEKELLQLDACQYYLNKIFSQFDEKIQSGVLASVAQTLSPFQHPVLVEAFCATHSKSYSMDEVLNGTVFLVDMPLSIWGVAGKVVYTFIKLRFFNVMQQRAVKQNVDQHRPVFFMCDEYQEIVSCNKDGLSDLNFWDKSRSSKTLGLISAQSVSSFYAAIGDRDLTHALLQNFRQKLIFRTEDDWTIEYCNRLVGQVEVEKIITSTQSGKSSPGHGQVFSSTNSSTTQTTSYHHKALVDGQLFRSLGENQMLALLSINGRAADDVLNARAIYF